MTQSNCVYQTFLVVPCRAAVSGLTEEVKKGQCGWKEEAF